MPKLIPVSHDPWADLPKGELGVRQGPMGPGDWLPFVGEALKQYGGNMLQNVVQAFKTPGDVMMGRVDPNSEEGRKRIFDLAGLAMTGPGAPSGALGSGLPLRAALKPYSGPIAEHPALSKMEVRDRNAGIELLNMVREYPEYYQNTRAAAEHLIKGGWLDDFDIPHVKNAAKMLQKYEEENGPFRFAEKPTAVLSPSIPPGPKMSTYNPPEPKMSSYNFEEALYPINWNDLSSLQSRPFETATGLYANTLARAKDLGFNVNLPLYHGTELGLQSSPILHENFYGPKSEKLNSFRDPKLENKLEAGIFFSDTPKIANYYAGETGEIMPVFARAENPLAVNWADVAQSGSYSRPIMSKLIEAAHNRAADMLVIHNIHDIGGPQTQYVALKPNILRSTFAKFNPADIESSNLLKSGGAPILIPVLHNPYESSND
jgi:hypothetical protein